MKLLCDSDVDRPLVDRLREDGHEVAYMTEIRSDSVDEEVLDLANATKAILVTRDKGFGQLVHRQGLAAHGVLLIRLAGVRMAERKELVSRAVQQHGHEFAGAFSPHERWAADSAACSTAVAAREIGEQAHRASASNNIVSAARGGRSGRAQSLGVHRRRHGDLLA